MNNQQTNQISVGLLLNDIREAKKISNVLRKVGIIAHFYEDLDSFWSGTLENMPALCIVDVLRMSEGEKQLKNHPFISSEELPVVFFHNESTRQLTYETYDIFNLGVIRQCPNYEGQMKSVLKRLNRLTQTEMAVKNLQYDKSKFNLQFEKLIGVNEGLKEKEYFTKMLKSLNHRFEAQRGAEDFISAFGNVVGNLKEVSEFAAFELSPSGQKLVSLNSRHKKFKKIPALWLGQTCEHGIEHFAQNLVSQVILDLMGGDIMSLNIKATKENPDVVIFLKVSNEDFLNRFDWETFEMSLNGYYNYFKLREKGPKVSESDLLSPWELLSFVDQYSFGKSLSDKQMRMVDEEHCLIDIDFTDMTDLIRGQKNNRFYWQDFFYDFFGKLKTTTPVEYKVSLFGITHAALLVSRSDVEELFQHVKAYTSRYPYWRMFENVDFAINESLKPAVRMSPFSSEALLNIIDEIQFTAPSEIQKSEVKEKRKEIIWGRAPEQTM